MSRSPGTGEPVAFRCWAERRGYGVDHRVELTGRSRRYRKGGQGLRTGNYTREYLCSCGHVGWSAHVDLARLAGRG